eukprot:scaffold125380_cov57-Phaeocystis_antarctica.AAC.2
MVDAVGDERRPVEPVVVEQRVADARQADLGLRKPRHIAVKHHHVPVLVRLGQNAFEVAVAPVAVVRLAPAWQDELDTRRLSALPLAQCLPRAVGRARLNGKEGMPLEEGADRLDGHAQPGHAARGVAQDRADRRVPGYDRVGP